MQAAASHMISAIAVTSALLLGGCGDNPTDRTEGGAAAGAATGATIGIIGGALIGGGAGALTGAATSPNQVNLGGPVWRR